MAGIYTDFKGSILINDVPIGNYDLASTRSQTGVLLNQQDVFQGTIWENISLGNEDISKESVIGYADIVGLNEFIGASKNGYDTMLDPSGERLPGKIIHKLLLVRALAGEPRLLLLEEPWIDTADDRRSQIIKLLTEIKNTTVVVISNDTDFAAKCDKIITMLDGRISISGTSASQNIS
jgi:ABC-type bacteriocin/lantibiotic exporter with double-glycine peptidase domain